MKQISTLLVMLIVAISIQAQTPFFKQVSYRGAFAPAPTPMWTNSWTNFDPNSTAYGTPTVTISGDITSNRTLDRDTVYLLSGLVFVKSGATLTIESGTVIRGNNAVANSALVVTRGSKLNALGTVAQPIVFTSSKAAGTRAPGDWGGIILLGNGSVNVPGGVGNIEGLTVSADTQFGGGGSPNDNESSGTLQYVRIEFGGFDFATDNEINGLTMGGVGRGTTIDHIQVSFNDDDCFEWFGGAVNCAYLVAYRGVDDNWDTDFGYSGSVQFCLGVRDPNLSDLSGGSSSEGFESDNDASGSGNTPKTSAIFSNVTELGPFRGTGAFPGGQDFIRGARIRRNSELKIFNSIITDYPRAITINEATVLSNFRNNLAKLENNIFGAYTTALFDGLNAGTVSLRDSLFNTVYKNDSLPAATAADDLLATPWSFTAPDYRPTATLAQTGAEFNDPIFTGRVQNTSANFVIPTAYRGAFAPTPAAPWTDGWVNYDPNSTVYGTPTVTISGTISSNRTLDRDTVYLLSGLVFVKNGATLTIESGTVIRGDNAVANSALVVTRGCKLNALGTATAPIVFTSSKAAGTRVPGDWGGIILLGNGIVNVPGGVGNIEGLTVSPDTQFGGTDSLDNSGVIQYVRIEFGGFDFATDNEINGLTMGGVGRGTTIDHIQVSFNDDDCFEWFGGNVNCSYLVAYRGVDDNWDTDFGYSGIVQFALGVRDPNLSDLSGGSSSEGFESDNDATGSGNTPKTSAIFTNVTELGPFRGTGAFPGGQDFIRGARIRRNSELKIFNSIITDYPRAMTINETSVLANFRANRAKLENNIFGAYTTALFDGLNAGTVSLRDSLFNTVYKNDSVTSLTAADDLLATPYNFLAPDYRPTALLATTGASFADEVFTGVVSTCPTLAPGTITGAANVAGCVGNIVYSVTAVPGAELYTWTVPTHFTIVSGQGTPTLTVTVNNASFVSGTLSVNASASCGSSAVSTFSVVDIVLPTPGTPTGGPLNVCAIAGTATQVTYSIPAVNGASSYLWTIPAGVTLVSGQGTRFVTVTINAGFTLGTLGVQAISACDTSALKTTSIKGSAPKTAVISRFVGGVDLPTNVAANLDPCPLFSDPNDPQSDIMQFTVRQDSVATSYLWTSSDPDMEIVGSATDTIVNIRINQTTLNPFIFGILTLTKTSGCGQSSKAIVLKRLSAAKVGKLLTFKNGTGPQGFVNVCDVVGQPGEFVRYQSPALPLHANTYNWSVENGSTSGGTMTIVGGGGPTDNFVDVQYTSGFTFGFVRVTSQNECSISAVNTLTVKQTIPVFPALTTISTTVPSGATLCGATNVVLTTSAIATDSTTNEYRWTLPTGVTPNASIPTTLIGSVVGGTQYSTASNSIAINWGSTTKSGKISVAGFSNCGLGKAISLTLVATPTQPASITEVQNCPVQNSYTYSVPAQTGATAYTWKVPVGVVINSGQGTPSITVTYPVTAVTGNVSVTVANSCGAALARNLLKSAFTPPACTPSRRPTTTVTDNGGNVITAVTGAKVVPNPNAGNFTLRINTTNVKDNAQIQVMDIQGKVVLNLVGVNTNGLIQANVSTDKLLPNGNYLVKYTIGTETGSVKMVVQK